MGTWAHHVLIVFLCSVLISCQAQKPIGSSTSSSNVCGSGSPMTLSSFQENAPSTLMATQVKARAMTGKLQLDGFELISKNTKGLLHFFQAQQKDDDLVLPVGSEVVLSVKTLCSDDDILANGKAFMYFKKDSPFKNAVNKIPTYISRT